MDPETTQTADEILSEPGAPVVMFDQVELAFDEKVVLRNISFTLISGHTKIILGASGSGKSTILKIITGLLRADSGLFARSRCRRGCLRRPGCLRCFRSFFCHPSLLTRRPVRRST